MVFRRLAQRRHRLLTLERQPDGLPKRGFFAEPVRVTKIQILEPESRGGGRSRVSFLVEVKDAEDGRCPDVAIEAAVSGPERSSTVQGTTDLMGRLQFRMEGPPGRYEISLIEVAHGGLDWDADAGPWLATVDVR